ncbi:MAG: hypothetical protein A3I11_06175 [Elusimicrobia bacterium RIFCSPLOWO2_02_FULL_39_32]|nr:MAG: hypothetical protein A2034_02695 [Elusimicrobia bacterium GWA2_38_7]OGR80950.1 MAG: hypothetical protein A3B80_04710 [Elusimicrobia bacterium RIFCSPHIGHO2_02_FULL_39_36]OGR91657.1 MAG: hypothetical protein A3I11_06175 [Elusimicrobia bacterium RIFCSPLOWO2_02_FULL_39_32]OGS00909.1 MAG: hypothetical protein A3G85_00305 [Elusimicrobia bacterium RIFCSPLOWO2_12_FULL_39_28]
MTLGSLYRKKNREKKALKLFSLIFLLSFSGAEVRARSLFSFITDKVSLSERKYLKKLAQDTYRCIDYYVDAETGLPLDNSAVIKNAFTSVTNIGFYMASVAGAVEMGFENRKTAVQKLGKLLESLNKLETWKNFPHSWNSLADLKKHKENFISTVDLGNYYAGIIVTRQTFPELKDQCDQLLKIDWQDLYDPRAKLLFGGFNTEKNEVGSWHYDFLGADSRLVSFLAIAMSGVPLQSWSALNRNLEERYGIQYLKPGWQGGGLFMGFMSGLFLDEEGSLPGLAAGNFAKAQMVHQEKIGSPVWGWSASDSPANGYLGFNAIRDEIITPHASTLAISVFPKEVIQNLKKLEELGVRPRHIIEGQYYDFGFRDAIDLKTARVTKNYLILDQTMLFLALTNFLENKFIIRAFNSYDGVMEGYKKIKDYQNRVPPLEIRYPFPLKEKFKLGVQSFDRKQPEITAAKNLSAAPFNPELAEWNKAEVQEFDHTFVENGKVADPTDLGAKIQYLWDEQALYLKMDVIDQTIVAKQQGSEIFRDDCVEIYIDPNGDGLLWGHPSDFQIGITPPDSDGQSHSYAWFQKRIPAQDEVNTIVKTTPAGYDIFTAISWKFLGIIEPVRGQSLGISIAVHDVDNDANGEGKLNWHFKSNGSKIELGKLILQ